MSTAVGDGIAASIGRSYRCGWPRNDQPTLWRGSTGVAHPRLSPDLFIREQATVALGVGKNVVSFIRHWCTAGTIERMRKRGDEIVPGSARM